MFNDIDLSYYIKNLHKIENNKLGDQMLIHNTLDTKTITETLKEKLKQLWEKENMAVFIIERSLSRVKINENNKVFIQLLYHEPNVTQGQFLRGLLLILIWSSFSYANCLVQAKKQIFLQFSNSWRLGTNELMPFPKISVEYEYVWASIIPNTLIIKHTQVSIHPCLYGSVGIPREP